MNELPEYVLDRVFDAPREMVWRAWTDPELLSRWYGPGVETIIHKFDLKPGGTWLNEMKWGDNSDLSKAVFQEIVPHQYHIQASGLMGSPTVPNNRSVDRSCRSGYSSPQRIKVRIAVGAVYIMEMPYLATIAQNRSRSG